MKSHLKQLALFVFAMLVAQSAQHLGKAVHPTSPVQPQGVVLRQNVAADRDRTREVAQESSEQDRGRAFVVAKLPAFDNGTRHDSRVSREPACLHPGAFIEKVLKP
jgi:hypothetical protein